MVDDATPVTAEERARVDSLQDGLADLPEPSPEASRRLSFGATPTAGRKRGRPTTTTTQDEEEDVPTDEERPEPAPPSPAMDEDRSDLSDVDAGEVEDDRAETHTVSDGEQLEDDYAHGRVHEGGDDTPDGARRSKRVRYPVLQYWKNERMVYHREDSGLGDVLPTVAGISERTKTPAVNRKQPKKRRLPSSPVQDSLPADELPADLEFKRGDKGKVWSEAKNKTDSTVLICRAKTMKKNQHPLPITAEREEEESDAVGLASKAFQASQVGDSIPGWISGAVELPPTAIKDAEGVGMCSQVFFVANCQPQAFEVAIALPNEDPITFEAEDAQRYLLSPGDQFFVPPGNVYRLKNHSEKYPCKMFWTIIKPIADADEE